ncbi:hypothetical protein BOTBODRAFT_339454 [Botryobasidium botryosum FD-172 SS1]|uniref:Uncharacterized protein n=1 Tax=Botryobasidium botryosum (strain FD-172 SS1) TaxID=930990 RepID=A0A067MT25_BOTB1|nr:hypothetical protein BOTBODRAFT_339454 [Botryobasidium botryosum FD-172 SS1]
MSGTIPSSLAWPPPQLSGPGPFVRRRGSLAFCTLSPPPGLAALAPLLPPSRVKLRLSVLFKHSPSNEIHASSVPVPRHRV